jgi:hypothetical protein
MTYTKPEVHEIGSAAEMIQSGIGGGIEMGQYFLSHLLMLQDTDE